MRRIALLSLFVIAASICLPLRANTQTDDPVKAKVDELVRKHYMDGIQYVQANALGSEAVPYLVEMLNNPADKQFWVNIIVTLGFIEKSSSLDPLISFLQNAEGEVDGFTFRALLSVPFAVGCIASNGDSRALDFLTEMAHTPPTATRRWSFGSQRIDHLLAEQSVTGLAVSGRAEAREELLKLKNDLKNRKGLPDQESLMESIDDGLGTMDRIVNEGRARIFNPSTNE
jgi:hypothetical protein